MGQADRATASWPAPAAGIRPIAVAAVALAIFAIDTFSLIVCETEVFSIDESWLPRRASPAPHDDGLSFVERLATHERAVIEAALAETGGRVSGPSGAAAKLSVPRSTLDSRIRSLKINKHRFKTMT